MRAEPVVGLHQEAQLGRPPQGVQPLAFERDAAVAPPCSASLRMAPHLPVKSSAAPASGALPTRVHERTARRRACPWRMTWPPTSSRRTSASATATCGPRSRRGRAHTGPAGAHPIGRPSRRAQNSEPATIRMHPARYARVQPQDQRVGSEWADQGDEAEVQGQQDDHRAHHVAQASSGRPRRAGPTIPAAVSSTLSPRPITAIPRNISVSLTALSGARAAHHELGADQHHGHASDQESNRPGARPRAVGLGRIMVLAGIAGTPATAGRARA